MKILVTGCAGFIGFHLCNLLLKNKNYKIYGIDNLNNYYDTSLKNNRLKILKKKNKFVFYKLDICSRKLLEKKFADNNFDIVIHLAAQAGVRYSISNPEKYLKSNIDGFFNVLTSIQKYKIKHFIFASTSSVYGSNNKFPTSENVSTDKPLSFYAASKKSNEVMAYSFSNIYNIPMTCLRFFTVYGEHGRPDMSLHKFVSKIIENKSIDLYNKGNHQRDFTYVGDVVEIIKRIIKNPSTEKIPYQVYNVASGKPKKLLYFVSVIEKKLNKKAIINFLDLQKGDVVKTHANQSKILKLTGHINYTVFEKGIDKFIKWFKKYYGYK